MTPEDSNFKVGDSQHPVAQTARGSRAPHPVWWVIAVSLAVIAAKFALQPNGSLLPSALGQLGTSAGAGGVFAFTGELTKGVYGVYMVDVDAGTIWAYEYKSGKGCLELAAARNWRYDRYLEAFDICGLSPEDVRGLVEEQRKQKLESVERPLTGNHSDEDESPSETPPGEL